MMRAMGERAQAAARQLGQMSRAAKDAALFGMADGLLRGMEEILRRNAADLVSAREKGLPEAMVERLTLNEKRVKAMADGVLAVAALPDPVGTQDSGAVGPSGIVIRKVRVPLGVIGIIYESRPDVTSDAAALCLKAGNACILRGGSEALGSNCAVMDALAGGGMQKGLPEGALQLVRDPSREVAQQMMGLRGLIDVLIPRGGAGLIQSVVQNARVPVIETGTGVCHVYVHQAADLAMAQKVAVSAKISRPSVCNAAETLLVDEAVAEAFLPACAQELREKGVTLLGCARSRQIVPWMKPATEADYREEHLSLILGVRVVKDIGEAIAHIDRFGTKHSEAIITRDHGAALAFQRRVDAACVYVNASTRFTDGGEFGFGAEIGISNQKLHARGPLGLAELTTYKYVIDGDGQIR